MNVDGRRQSSNVEDRRAEGVRVAKSKPYLEKIMNKAKDQSARSLWDKAAIRHMNEGNDNIYTASGLEDSYYDRLQYNIDNYGYDENRPVPEAKKDKTNVHIGRRKSLDGNYLGEYKMK